MCGYAPGLLYRFAQYSELKTAAPQGYGAEACPAGKEEGLISIITESLGVLQKLPMKKLSAFSDHACHDGSCPASPHRAFDTVYRFSKGSSSSLQQGRALNWEPRSYSRTGQLLKQQSENVPETCGVLLSIWTLKASETVSVIAREEVGREIWTA